MKTKTFFFQILNLLVLFTFNHCFKYKKQKLIKTYKQLNNGIPILAYYDDPFDTELKDLTELLKKIHNIRDPREIIR